MPPYLSILHTPPKTILPQCAQSTLRCLSRRCQLDGQFGIDEVAARLHRRRRRSPHPTPAWRARRRAGRRSPALQGAPRSEGDSTELIAALRQCSRKWLMIAEPPRLLGVKYAALASFPS